MKSSNVILFSKKQSSQWVFISDSHDVENPLSLLKKGAPISWVSSQERLIQTLIYDETALFFVSADLTWADPSQMISDLTRYSNVPVILTLKKNPGSNQEVLIKKAYRAGVFDICYLPSEEEELVEVVELALKVSRQARGF